MTQTLRKNEITKDDLVKYLDMYGYSKAPENIKEQFISIAIASQLNPFTRELHMIKYGEDYSIVTGYEVYTRRAENSGKLDGWSVGFDGSLEVKKKAVTRRDKNGNSFSKEVDAWDGDLSCTITIYRNDMKYPVIHTVDFAEFSQDNSNWFKRPKFMLRKVAISQGFRLAFPNETKELPRTEEEAEITSIEARNEQMESLSQIQQKAIEMLEQNAITLQITPEDFQKIKSGIELGDKQATDAISWMNAKLDKLL